jgi:ABC-type nitrate/sulfonate/bicarbonate transport system permease component
VIGAVLIFAALLGAWELYVRLGGVDPLILPAPHEVARSLWDDHALLGHDLWVTAQEVLLGIGVAVAVGLLFAVAVHFFRPVRRAVYPLLVASQTIPVPVIAPLLVVWLGFGIGPKLLVIALICFFPITVSTLDALAAVDPALLKLMRTLDASRWQVFRRVEAPAALPALFSGARIAVAVAVIAAVLGETAGSSAGLGHLITVAGGSLQTAQAYAAVVLLSVLAVALFALLTALERLLVPWARTAGGPSRP